MASASYPNISNLEAALKAIGPSPSVSFQPREGRNLDGTPRSGFFTVTYYPAGDTTRCAIGQGDALADALDAARKDAASLIAKTSIADIEKAAA